MSAIADVTQNVSAALERHYSPDELAELWNLSADTIRRMFEAEPGVLVIEQERAKSRRRYRTFRIPESVALRVHRRKEPSSVDVLTPRRHGYIVAPVQSRRS